MSSLALLLLLLLLLIIVLFAIFLVLILLRRRRRRWAVVCDASVLIAFARIRQFTLLRRLFGRLFVPPDVWAEVRNQAGYGPGAVEIQRATWIRRVPLRNPQRVSQLIDLYSSLRLSNQPLDAGEAAAIALAEELRPAIVLVDDTAGRIMASHLGIERTGTLGIIKRAKQEGKISAGKPLLDALINTGFYIGQRLYADLLRDMGEL